MTMTPVIKDTQAALDRQAAHATFRAFVQEQVRLAIRATFIDILEAQVTQFIGAERYERTTERRDQRAGYRSRTLGTTAGLIDDLPVPRTRGAFHSQLFEHYQRRRTEVDTLMRDRFVGGLSQRSVGALVEQVTGTPASPSTVSPVKTPWRPSLRSGKSASCPRTSSTSLPTAPISVSSMIERVRRCPSWR
jgi:putative transposase